MELLPFAIFVLAWYFVAKFYKNKGYRAIIRHLAGFAAGLLGLVVAIITIMPKPDAVQTTAEKPKPLQVTQEVKQEAQPQPVEPKPELNKEIEQAQEKTQTLELDIKKFVPRVNKALKNAQLPYKMTTPPKVDEGEVNDVAKYMFTENFGVIITLDKKTHKIKSLMTVVTPSGDNAEENLLILFANAAVLSAFEGENEIKTVGKKIMEMTTSVMTEYGKTKQDVSKDFIFNGKKYGISVSQYTGIMAYADFAD